MNKKTTVINLYGGPGTGKSTTAAGLFHLMKLNDYKVELVTEFAKHLVYEERLVTLDNQLYIFAKQYHKMKILMKHVDYIITDSPLVLSLLYYKGDAPYWFTNMVVDVRKEFENIDIFLNRVKKYQEYGRQQTYEEAIEIDKKIKNYIKLFNSYTTFDANKYASSHILKKLKNIEERI